MDALYYNGFKLAYRRYGASDAPAVVLIMGLGMSSAAWPTSLIAHLVREGFQVITRLRGELPLHGHEGGRKKRGLSRGAGASAPKGDERLRA